MIKSKKPSEGSSTSTAGSGSSNSVPGQSTGQSAGDPFSGLLGSGLGSGLFGGLGGGLGGASFAEMQQRMQQDLMSNPEMIRQMMDNPMVQSIMSNPEYIRMMFTSNPQMQQLMERNPELSHMLNNPELLRQTMEMVRNPAALQELMRTQDRALSNLESIPGGYNALRRMYTELQEPMLNAAQEQFGSNPFAALVSDSQSGQANRGTEVRDPLPNPWAARPPAPGDNASTANNSTSNGSSGPGGSSGGVFDSPGFQSLLSQVSSNPEMIQSMMSAPYMQTMMQTMSSNPQLMQSMLDSNPLLAGNPALQEQMRNMLPQMAAQMSSPEMQSVFTNPQALEAIFQIQRGLSQLQRVAPNLVTGL